MHRIAIVLAVALTFAACGDDGGGSEDAARFCEIDQQIEDLAEPTTPEEGAEFLSEFQDLVAEGASVAPGEVSDAVGALASAVEGLTFEDLVTLDSSEFEEALAGIGDWTDENC
jgi:hypothetical protein